MRFSPGREATMQPLALSFLKKTLRNTSILGGLFRILLMQAS